MATIETRWLCDICRTPHDTEQGALACEAKGWPEPWPKGMIFFPKHAHPGVIFAVIECTVKGHNKRSRKVVRSWQTMPWLPAVLETPYVVKYGELAPPDTTTEDFARMVAFLRAQGSTPSVWDGEKAVALGGEGST